MKLLRFGVAGQEKPGMLDSKGHIRDLSGELDDITGKTLSQPSLRRLAQLDPEKLPLVSSNPRIGPCIGHVGNLICIGLNYKDHALETGAAIPAEPVVFTKITSAICGPYDDVIIPKGSQKTDWEVELAVVIGTTAKSISEKEALQFIAGFCIMNDISERCYQLEGTGQWVKGKSCPTFAPIGPWLVTTDEITDVQNLDLWLTVDNQPRQRSNTKEMVFHVAYLISYLSHFFTLQPGDVVSTGTPAGVGFGYKPTPLFLKPGQTMHLGVTHLGEQKQRTVQEM